MHTKKENKHGTFRCDRGDCKLAFGTLANLKNHLRLHDNDLFRCYFCPWASCNRTDKMDHLNHHLGIRPHKCSFCEKRFSKAKDKTRHEESYHEKVFDRYKCLYCDFKTYSHSVFEGHKVVHK